MHVCICGRYDWEHDEVCYYGDGDHRHYPALCCPECPCDSFKEAHPEEFGVPIGTVEGITPGLAKILRNHSVHTAEDLLAIYPHSLLRMRGIGWSRFLRLTEIRMGLKAEDNLTSL